MVFVPGKGGQEESFNPWFAYGLGVGNEFAKRTIMRLRTQWAPGFMSRVNKIPILDKFIQANLGAGGGVGAMELGKLFSGDSEMIKYLDSKIIDNTDYSKYLENGFRSEEEYRAHIINMHDEAMYGMVKQAGSDYLGMLFLNLANSSTFKAVGETIENYNIKKKRVSKATKVLTSKEDVITEDSSPKEVEDAASKKEDIARDEYAEVYSSKEVKEVREKKEKGEELNNKDKKTLEKLKKAKKKLDNTVENIKTAKEDIIFRNDLEMLKKVIGQDKKKWRKFEKEAFVLEQTMMSGKQLGGKNAQKFGDFTTEQLEYYIKTLESKGINKTFPRLRETITAQHEFYKSVNEVIKEKYKNTLNEKEYNNVLDKNIEYYTKAKIRKSS